MASEAVLIFNNVDISAILRPADFAYVPTNVADGN